MKALPRGVVYNGSAIVRVGDRLKPQDLPHLTFQPDPGVTGDAGALRYVVDNGRGNAVEGSLDVEVAPAVNATDLVSQSTLWEELKAKGGKAEMDAFLRLFPASRFAEEARRLRGPVRSQGRRAARSAARCEAARGPDPATRTGDQAGCGGRGAEAARQAPAVP